MKRKPAAVCVNQKLLLWVRPNFVEHRGSGPSVILLAVKLTSGYLVGWFCGAVSVSDRCVIDYVIGDEPLVEIDWSGLEAWTGFKVRLHDRVLAGLLMTDIVGSTHEASKVGDALWRRRLADHHESMRSHLGRFRGREVDTAGDGMFALFDGAARALECAAAIQEAAKANDTPVRIGVHVGEVELTSNGARGIAVHEVARITAAAGPGEILAFETTRTLSMGAGLGFEDRGAHDLKGLDGARRLFAFLGSTTTR